MTGRAGQLHRIERTSTLTNPAWNTVGVVTLDGSGQAMFEDATSGQAFPLYYRAVAE